MNKILLTTVTAIAITASTAFAAENNHYVKFDAGMSRVGDLRTQFIEHFEHDQTTLISLAAGYKFGKNHGKEARDLNGLRIDVSFNYLFNTDLLETIQYSPSYDMLVKYHASSVLLNAYYDFYAFGEFKTFVGAGIGSARGNGLLFLDRINSDFDINYPTSPKSHLSYAFYTGITSEISSNIHAQLSYSYMYWGQIDNFFYELSPSFLVDVYKTHITSHNLTLGVRFDI